MKKIIFIIFIFVNLYATDNYTLKLYEAILPKIFDVPIKVYIKDDIKSILSVSREFIVVDSCDETVDILIGKHFDNLPESCQKKPVFATSYNEYKDNIHSFGAFYWRKGRPQIRFNQINLQKYNLVLPTELQKYMR